jgi:hypothetical protein
MRSNQSRFLGHWPAMLLICLLTGCYQMTIMSASEEPVLLNGAASLQGTRYRVIRHFYRQQQLDYVFGVNEQQDTLVSRLLQEESGPKAGVINLEVRRTFQALDLVVSVLTLGIYSRAWVVVEGDVIEWL